MTASQVIPSEAPGEGVRRAEDCGAPLHSQRSECSGRVSADAPCWAAGTAGLVATMMAAHWCRLRSRPPIRPGTCTSRCIPTEPPSTRWRGCKRTQADPCPRIRSVATLCPIPCTQR